MEGIVGFRPPQFSEDAAWLPTWLQQPNVEKFDEVIKRGETSFEQRIKELLFLGQKIGKEESASLSSSPEDCYTNCHFLLSGDDSSPSSFHPSGDDVFHFHLHLSSDGNSESILRPLMDGSQLQEPASDHAVLKQPLENSAVPEGKTNESNLRRNTCLISYSPNIKADNQNVVVLDKESMKCSEVDDVSEVVELSIAASEAVLIHEIMESLPVSTTLQVAFQLKQARLDVWKENLHTGNVSEVDDLSDLEDLAMADVYEDVGFSIADSSDLDSFDLSVSQVKDTLAPENGGYDGCVKYESPSNSHNFAEQKMEEFLITGLQLKDSLESEVFYGNRQNKASSNLSVCLDSINTECPNDPLIVSYSMRKENFFRAPEKSSLARTSEDAEKYNKVSDAVRGRFQSRWFGGWTCKQDVESSALVQLKNIRSKAFVGETSYFSESADIASDENSFVQKQDKRTVLGSQSSSLCGGLCNKENKGRFVSEDVNSGLSLPCCDPLCSVVPCSISSENISTTPFFSHEENMFTRRYVTSTAECMTENLPRAVVSQDKITHAEDSIVLVTHSEGLQAAVTKQLASLRPYSVLPSCLGTISGKGSSCNKQFLQKGNSGVSIMQKHVSDLASEEKYNKTAENMAESPILKKKENNSPVILNCRSCHCFQTFHHSVCDFGEEQMSLMKDCSIELLSKDHSCENEYTVQASAKKCVHFLDAVTKGPPKKKLRTQLVANKSCYIARPFKKLGCTNPHTRPGAQEIKCYRTSCLEKDQKKQIFKNIQFLLTGFSSRKEKEFEGLIRRYGGMVLSDIPSPSLREKKMTRLSAYMLPVVLCLKKLQTVKFLYGCAVKAFVLKVDWLIDSIVAGSVLPPEQYSVLPKKSTAFSTSIGKPTNYNCIQPIFGNVGIMLHGKIEFCVGLAKVIKHGGGHLFKTLQSLIGSLEAKKIFVGAIVVENERIASRHLKHCALEHKIPVLSKYWIIKSLHMGKLLRCIEDRNSSPMPPIKLHDF